MSDALSRLVACRKQGDERFRTGSQELDFARLDFWQWATSDLISNVTRGRLAEYIVARALGIPTDGVRDEWAAFDLRTPSRIKVEVKSAAYVQSWHQVRLSDITFRVPKTRAWDAETNTQASEPCRQADVYVFALLAHTNKATVDPFSLSQWRFYVLPTAELNARTRSQHSITLKSLETLAGGGVSYAELPEAVVAAAGQPLM